jgi:imidazolonepropionase-like amidohydrolase
MSEFKKKLSLFGILLAFLCSRMPGEQPKPARSPQVAIKAGRLIDVRTGQVSSNVFILIEKDRIVSVGNSALAGVPVIDLSDLTILPGLIDCHAHLLGDFKDFSAASGLRMSSAQAAIWGVRNLQVWLQKGFTALRDAGEYGQSYGQIALRDSVRKGLIQGPRIFSAGSLISVTGGHGDADLLAPDQALPRRPNLADTLDGISIAVRLDIKYGADWIKLMATGGVMDVMSDYSVQELSEEQMAKAVEIAHRAHKKVMAHAEGAEGIKAAVRAGVDSIEHGTMLDDEGAALMAAKRIWLVPTIYTFYRTIEVGTSLGLDPVSMDKSKEILKYLQPAFARALKYHLKIAFGLDDDPDYLPKEFGALVRGGMTPLEALQTATVNGAELLGMSGQIGTIEPGAYADIIAVAGDPLRDIEAMDKVVFVMKGGEVIKK